MSTTFQVGLLLQLDEADPELDSQQKALDLAVAESTRREEAPIGVWTGQAHGSELVAIAYQGQLFRNSF